jgi:hypothetical protein
MHKHVTHNRCHATFADFSGAILTFLREEVARKWHLYCDAVSDNFRIISPKDFRILAGTGDAIPDAPKLIQAHRGLMTITTAREVRESHGLPLE